MPQRTQRAQSRRPLSAVSADRPPYVRILGACLLGVLLLGTAFRAVAGNSVAGLNPNYGPRGGDSDGGISGAAIAGIVVGAGAGIAVASGAFAGGAGDECREPQPTLPERLNQFSEIRLTPRETTIESGDCRCFFLEVLATEDKKWYSVTHSSNSTLELQSQSECVVKRDGSKNVFCVPIDAAKSCDGKLVTVVGTYTHATQAPMTATATIRVRIPQGDK
jgi:hypothetical protein